MDSYSLVIAGNLENNFRMIPENIRKSSQVVENIEGYSADPTGIQGSADAITDAIIGKSDVIYIPKGVFLVEKDITIPTTKKLIFSRNARLKPANGVSITVNGTWEAGESDWIFDLSLGGLVNGDPKMSEVRPEWFGAKGDGVTDDTQSFNDAMILCAKKRIFVIGSKNYKITSTIENNARGIRGIAKYTDSANGGSILTFDPVDKETDLLPCLRISAGAYGGEFKDFSIMGKVNYSSRDLSQWVNKELFEQDKYEMFATGCVGVEVAGSATPVFRNIQTARVKVGIVLNSTNGHITTYDCNWNGLIGMYCKKNSEDYFFQGGGISGSFCGLMVGIQNHDGHRGGMGLDMNRVHMGFAPYSIYQVKDSPDYDSIGSVVGIYGKLSSVRFERIGESAIKLLPKSDTSGLVLDSPGVTWSSISYSPSYSAWESALPDSLKNPEDKQKYAYQFGTLRYSNILYSQGLSGRAIKSTAPGALNASYVHFLKGSGNDISGLNPSQTTIIRKETESFVVNTPYAHADSAHTRHLNPVQSGNIAKNPEVLSNWVVLAGSPTISMVNGAGLPAPFTSEMKTMINENTPVLKITPDGVNVPTVKLNINQTVDDQRSVAMEYFIYTSKAITSRLEYTGHNYLYHESYYPPTPNNNWLRVTGRDLKNINTQLLHALFYNLSKSDPTYIVGVMVSYDGTSTYTPHQHTTTDNDFELLTKGAGLILNSSSGARYKCHLNDKGVLSMSDMATGASTVFATMSVLDSLPTADESQRGRVLTVQGKKNISEVVEITITNKCTTAGPATLKLGGRSFTVQLTTADNTPELVASKIRQLVPDNNWSLSGTGRVITCTSTIFGDRADHSYIPGSTGATGNTVNTVQGSTGTADQTFICKKLLDDSYTWAEI